MRMKLLQTMRTTVILKVASILPKIDIGTDEMAIDDAVDSEESEQDDFQDVKSKSIPPFLLAS